MCHDIYIFTSILGMLLPHERAHSVRDKEHIVLSTSVLFRGPDDIGFLVDLLDLSYISSFRRQPPSRTTRNNMAESRERVIIVGTGWAGYNLCQNLLDKKFNITVISPQDTSPYTPLLVKHPAV